MSISFQQLCPLEGKKKDLKVENSLQVTFFLPYD